MELCAKCCRWLIVDDINHIVSVKEAVRDFLDVHPVIEVTFYDTWRGQMLLRLP